MPGLVLAAAYICFAIVRPACQMLEIPSVSSLESIREVIPLVVPGFVFLWVRAQLLTGRLPAPSHAVLPWVIFSSVYWYFIGAANDLFGFPGLGERPPWVALVVVVGVPMIAGGAAGWLEQQGLVHQAFRKVGLHIVLAPPSAWDGKFSKFNSEWVLITLRNGEQIPGYLGPESVLSSDPSERDIYVQEIFEVNDKGQWASLHRGLWVAQRDILKLEFSGETQPEHGQQNEV